MHTRSHASVHDTSTHFVLGLIVQVMVLGGGSGLAQGQPSGSLEALELSLHTGNPITVAESDRDERFFYQVSAADDSPSAHVRLHLEMTGYDGRTHEWTSRPLAIEPGEPVKVPLGTVLPSLGWWRIEPTVRAVDGSAMVKKTARQLACIDPVGPRDLPPTDGFWFGLDSRHRTPGMLRLFSRMGVDMLRYGTWSGVYDEEGQLQWNEFDQTVEAIHDHGMQALYSITFTPGWAVKPAYRGKGHPSRLPPRPEALRQSLSRIIEHTRDKGLTVYDLWNEPDHAGFWHGDTNDYLEFLRVAYQTIKDVQPKATVLSGGIASLHEKRFHRRNPNMNQRILLEGQEWFDAISYHEHGPFDSFADAIDGPLARYRQQMNEDKPLWFTETGHDVSGVEKARTLVRKFTYARAHGADGFLWFSVFPPGQGGGYNIVDERGDPQPVIPAYNQMVKMMRGKRFAREFEDDEQAGNRLFSFSDESETLLVAWGKGAAAHRAKLRLGPETEARMFDIMGRSLDAQQDGDVVYLPFHRTPQYLLVAGECEVVGSDTVTPLALFEFGNDQPNGADSRARVSPLRASGWNRTAWDDRDKRLNGTASGNPNALFDGEGTNMQLSFTVTPPNDGMLDFDALSFWGNAGAYNDTSIRVQYQLVGKPAVGIGSTALGNLSTPRLAGEFYRFDLSDLVDIENPVTFTITVKRHGKRAILKIDDLRVDGRITH
ncbi:MAG: hypothetical protein ACQESR_18265 [Planctomycetota bacterium]